MAGTTVSKLIFVYSIGFSCQAEQVWSSQQTACVESHFGQECSVAQESQCQDGEVRYFVVCIYSFPEGAEPFS